MPNTGTTKYIYHSEKTKTTCENCKKHDNEVYYDIKDVPKLPIHPNCKCWIEVVELKNNDNGNTKCDCKDRFLVLENNLNNSMENIDSMLKSIDDNILDIEEEINDENEENTKNKIISKFYLIKNKIDSFKKECEDKQTDIETTKEYKYDPTYHTIDECYSNKELKEHSKSVSRLCSKLDNLSEGLKEIKEEKKNIIKELKNTNKEEQKNHEKELEELKQGTMTGGAASISNNYENKTQTENLKIELSKLPIVGKVGATVFGGPDAAGMLNIAEGKNVPIYTKDAIKIDNIGNLKIDELNNGSLKKWKPYMANKIKNQFKDFNYKVGDIEGYVFKNHSAPVVRIKNSDEFKNILLINKYNVLSGRDFSNGFKKDKNLANAYGKVDFLNGGIDKNGNLHLYMFDTYDFNKNETPLVEAARRQMLKGSLKPFFTIHEMIISKDEADEIFK